MYLKQDDKLLTIKEFMRVNGLHDEDIFTLKENGLKYKIFINDVEYEIDFSNVNKEQALLDVIDDYLTLYEDEGKIHITTFSTEDIPFIVRITNNDFTEDFMEEDEYSEEYIDWCIEEFYKDYRKFLDKTEIRFSYRTENRPCLKCLEKVAEEIDATLNIHSTVIPAYNKRYWDVDYIVVFEDIDKQKFKDLMETISFQNEMVGVDVQINGHFVDTQELLEEGIATFKQRRVSYPTYQVEGVQCI